MNSLSAKLYQILFLLVIGVTMGSSVAHAQPSLRIYPSPSHEPVSTYFSVAVENRNVPVYVATTLAIAQVHPEVRQKGTAGFASFDTDGTVLVSVTIPEAIKTVKILPASRGVVPVISGNRVTFTVAKPGALTLEVNGDWMNSLHIFVNPLETNIPRANDPNVIYFGPGIHVIDTLKVGAGKTVYVAGGAVLYGKHGPAVKGAVPVISVLGSDIVLRGRGIIDASLLPDHGGGILNIQGTRIHIEGVILRDSAGWTVHIHEADNIKVHNVKIIGWRSNSDGIDINNSRNVSVDDCFIRTFDDLVVIKTSQKGASASRDIGVSHCVLWNEIAHALSLGAELREAVENVHFFDCDIIHDKGREWLLRVFNADSGKVKNIVFDNIRIEESRRLFSLWIGKDIWSKEADAGHIDNIIFNNIHSAAPSTNDRVMELQGFDAQHIVDNVEFNNVWIGGKPLRAQDIHTNAFVKSIEVQP